MLTADEIDVLKDKSQSLINSANQYAIQEICRQLSIVGKFNSASEYRMWQAQKMGIEYDTLIKEIAKRLANSEEQIKEMHSITARALYNSEMTELARRTLPFEKNTTLQQIIKASAQLATKDFTNLTQTMGMVVPSKPIVNVGKELPLDKSYTKTMDWVFNQVSTGMLDHNTAVRIASKLLSAKGITAVNYQSGVVTSLEAAVKRNIMGGLGLLTEKVTEYNHQKIGATGWEISAHTNSAPDHEEYQGKQYANVEWERLNGTAEKPGELKRRIGTLNCGHVAFPIILGVNLPQYTEEQLEELKNKNEAGIEYEGKHYTGYEAKQRQRAIERQIRFHKKRLYAAQGSKDEQLEQQEQIRLARLRDEYAKFSKAAGLKTQESRLHTAQFGREKHISNNKNGIIQKNGLYKITDESISNARLPKSEILGEDGDKILLQNSKELLQAVRNEEIGTEYGKILSIKTGKVINDYYGVKGMRSVSIGRQSEPFYMIHNHPSDMTFSSGDINNFINTDNLKGLIAIGNKGSGYMMEKLPSYNKEGYNNFFQRLSKHCKYETIEEILDMMKKLQEGALEYGVYFAEKQS